MNDEKLMMESIWSTTGESIEDVERRIHDSADLKNLQQRADSYVHLLLNTFNWVNIDSNSEILEIGSGLGYIMQGMQRISGVKKINGLDISKSMIQSAKDRLARDNANIEEYNFIHYDGVTIPLVDKSIDFVYSNSCIQHIPKQYAYNLFFEIHRILKDGGFFVSQLLSWNHLQDFEKWRSFKDEVKFQINQVNTHWHHFYSTEELRQIFEVSISASKFGCIDNHGCIVLAIQK